MKSFQNVEQLQGILTQLETENQFKKDLVAAPKHLAFENGRLIVHNMPHVSFAPTKVFHAQIAAKLDIPSGYYNRMLANSSSLLDGNVNHWLANEESKNFLVRTFQGGADEYAGTARAFLSDSYSVIDNYEILFEALEAIKNTGVRVEVVNAELSNTKMYLKVVAPEVEISAGKMLKEYRINKEVGDGIISGFTLSNSEIGHGAFNIMPRALILTCKNGATITTDSLKRVHLGGKLDELGFNKNDRIKKANIRLIKEQIQHAVKVFLSKAYLEKLVNVYSVLGEEKIEAPVQNVIEVVGKKFSITEERKANILKYFIEGGDTRRMGLANALTYEVQGLKDADLRHEGEVAAFDMLNNFKTIEAQAMKMKNSAN